MPNRIHSRKLFKKKEYTPELNIDSKLIEKWSQVGPIKI